MSSPIWGVCGPSGSGKSTFAADIAANFEPADVAVLHFDAYYRDLGHMSFSERCEVDFDHPDALDIEMFVEHLDLLRGGESVAAPTYDFTRHTRTAQTITVGPARLVLTEGILLLAVPEIRERLDVIAFLDIDSDTCMARRLERDVNDRGRDPKKVIENYQTVVKVAYDNLVAPHIAEADLIAHDQASRDAMLAALVDRAERLMTLTARAV